MPYKITSFIYFFFFALFFNLIPGRFVDLKFSGYQIGIIFGIIPVTAFFCNIILGELADKYQIRKQLLISISATASILMIPLLKIETLTSYYCFSIIMGSMVYPIISLNDSLVISYTKKNSISYGNFRQWGTIGFICGNLFLIPIHYLLKQNGIDSKNIIYLLPMTLIFLPITLRHALDIKYEKKTIKWSDSILFFKTKSMILLLIAVFFHNVAFVSLYSYFTPHLKIMGHTQYFISICWAISPILEIFIFRHDKLIFKKFNPVIIFRLAIFIGGIRWLFVGYFQNKFIIAASQLLHSISFGAYYIAAIFILSKIVPEKLRSSGQGLFSAIISIAMFTGNMIFGYIYQTQPTQNIFKIAFFLSMIGVIFSVLLSKRTLLKKVTE